uniref:C1q domain-containing protein n=1 Tax=Periophthalmus magnuspinnatus TaxID=409849 RepID=A0A3B4BEA2_9GOBI
MLLRLLGLMVLCVLCSSMLHFPPETHHNTTDNTKFFNKYGNFSNKGLPAEAQGGVGLGKSLLPSEPSGSTVPEDIGMPGDKGDKGDRGLNGRNGLIGLKGEQGSPGPCDLQGSQGDIGMPGPCSLAIQSAFSVALATPFPVPDRPVKFSKIICNVQSHYNPLLGIYTAPVDGTYVFTFNAIVKDKKLVVGLFHNFEAVMKMTKTTDTTTVSQEVMLHLTARDMVWVQVKDSNSNGMFAGIEMASTFSGWLLHPDTCDFSEIREFIPLQNVTGLTFPWD